MAFQRGGFRSQSRGPRRVVDWGLGPAAEPEIFTATGTQLWSLGTTPSQKLTVVRTRGWINYYLTATAAILDGFAGASGIYLMTEDAFLVGDAAAVDPLTDANSDVWLWHSFFDIRSITATIGDGVNSTAIVVRQEIDSKAMRKNFDPEMVMVGVTEVVEQGTATLTVRAEVRQLLKH